MFNSFSAGTRLYTSELDVFRRQILTSKVSPRTEKNNMGLMSTRRLRHWPNIKPTLDNRFFFYFCYVIKFNCQFSAHRIQPHSNLGRRMICI